MYFLSTKLDYQKLSDLDVDILVGEECKHFWSLRVKVGQIVNLTNLQGYLLKVKILDLDKKAQVLKFQVLEKYYQPYFHSLQNLNFTEEKYPPKLPKILCQAIIDKIYLEKLFEIVALAFDEVCLFYSQFSNSKENINKDRLEKILIRSCQQAQRLWKPKIVWLKNLPELQNYLQVNNLPKPIVLDTYSRSKKEDLNSFKENSYCLLVGPEGGFSQSERELFQKENYKCLNLGGIIYPAWICGLIASKILTNLD